MLIIARKKAHKPAVNDVIWRLFFINTVNIFWFDTYGGGDLWTDAVIRGGNSGRGSKASSCSLWPASSPLFTWISDFNTIVFAVFFYLIVAQHKLLNNSNYCVCVCLFVFIFFSLFRLTARWSLQIKILYSLHQSQNIDR